MDISKKNSMGKCPHGINCDGKCTDPNTDNGMMTKIWGPSGWLFLHSITFGYPYTINPTNPEHIDKPTDYANFFHYLGKVMPCRYCRESYQDFIREHPIEPHLKSRSTLAKWLYDIHNKVNNKLGVPQCNIPSFDEVFHKYENYRAKCAKTTVEERELNKTKGCITPANGTKQRTIIKIIKTNTGDITRRDNAVDVANQQFSEMLSPDDFELIDKKTLWGYYFIICVLSIVCLYYVSRSFALPTFKKSINKSFIKVS